MVIEPSTTFKENYPLLMTATVVDINYVATQKVRILNPLDESISIKLDCTVGQAEPIVSIQTIMDTEDEGEVNNYCYIRSVKSRNDQKNSPAAMSENGPKIESYSPEANSTICPKIESCSPEANADSGPKLSSVAKTIFPYPPTWKSYTVRP